MNGSTAPPATVVADLAGDAPATALGLYGAALAAATAGAHPDLSIGTAEGRWSTVDVRSWVGDIDVADLSLVSRCGGPTLDVGCGPGRFTEAVAVTGTSVLGVDVSPVAVRLTRRRGGPALCRSVFHRLPGEGRWSHVLLADGNIGIGGDPVRLLRRCRTLLAATGTVLVELGAPGTGSGTATVRLRYGGARSEPFRWAYLAADEVAGVAAPAGLGVLEHWTEGGRWFATLCGN